MPLDLSPVQTFRHFTLEESKPRVKEFSPEGPRPSGISLSV